MGNDLADAPPRFQEALRTLADARVRGDVQLVEVPAPSRIAPYAVAVSGEVAVDQEDDPAATGRFVVLHDPEPPSAWNGDLRVVALVKAEVETEVGADELWSQVAWSWIQDALADTPHRELGGTVTKVTDEGFGDLAGEGQRVRVELRVSWTLTEPNLAPHVIAWTQLLATTAGVPPLPDGVTMLRGTTA